ncbi:MAG TPA: SigE family RNA polymerase sigma factor [Micromonosporaceae bacterium]|nr:SigE family RNA polymerase sigma factor [Micromonosporaceae bacterium]
MREHTVDVLRSHAAPADSRDPGADDITALYCAVTPRAIRLAYLLTSDQALAEDVVQDAFIRVASRLTRIREPHAIEAYLRRAVINEIVARRRSLARQTRRQQVAAFRPASGSPMDQVEQRIDLVESLNVLPLLQRTAILLKYWMDLTDVEIADAMNCPVGTVKSRLSRGLDTLRKVAGDDS